VIFLSPFRKILRQYLKLKHHCFRPHTDGVRSEFQTALLIKPQNKNNLISAACTQFSLIYHKAIHATGRESPQGCETLRLLHLLDNLLTEGGEVVSLKRRPPCTPRKIPGTHFCYRMSLPQSHSAAGRIRSLGKSIDIGNRIRDLAACNTVPQPTTLLHAPYFYIIQ
jgi:hypothetical protein